MLVAVPDSDRAFTGLMAVVPPGGYIVVILYCDFGWALRGTRHAVIGPVKPHNIDLRASLAEATVRPRQARIRARRERLPKTHIVRSARPHL